MLTDLFYYNHYKPYMISGTTSKWAVSPATKIKTPEVKEELRNNGEIHKNLAYKNDVVNYAKDFSTTVVGLKDSSKILTKNSDIIKIAAHTEGLDSAMDWAEEDITDFADSFNSLKEFAKAQTHSRAITNLADDIANDLFDNASLLSNIGVVISEEGYLDVDKEKIKSRSYAELSESLDGLKELGSTIYDKTSDFLKKPLADHMLFRPFNYYYNYKLGTVTHNPFQLVETGMLVDFSV